MTRYLASFALTALAAVTFSAHAEEIQQPRMMTLTKGIVCETAEASRAAFDWAADHPEAQYVDLAENPQCIFIDAPIVAMVQPLEMHENDVAGVVIGQATPRNGDTRYIWMDVRMKPRQTTFEQDA